ncbi:helix-turn-helix transcriptional regulator [Tenacibaculum maritimum]|nr:helix-turn-helix transcriptional regulator [Tenacibaculum maritimum]MDB0600479.1 helix-turn-helix transcriptional regulator [Tenacibaculum maritimum]MDB0610633.1 helix-turn-helix transcriptional regulator [Tenacibaculum maritimum]
MVDIKEIGDRIKHIMNKKGLNYRSLSRLMGCSDVQVRRICLNESLPKIDFIQHFCNIFPDVDVTWLVTGNQLVEKKEITSNEIEVISIKLFDKWDEFMKNRLFKANFESKAASWALKVSNEKPE